MKSILVTGAEGFIGRNLVLALNRLPDVRVFTADLDTPTEEWSAAFAECDVVVHLAGVNRPQKEEDYEAGNVGSLSDVLAALGSAAKLQLIILSSSTQALLGNPYGRSKRLAEQLLFEFSEKTGTPIRVFRLPGVFGKWSRPNYNSVIATFCYNISRGIPIQVSDASMEIEIVYVGDVVSSIIGLIGIAQDGAAFVDVEPVFKISLGRLARKLSEFYESRATLRAVDLSNPLDRRLYGTFVSYLPTDGFAYCLSRKSDFRGDLAEIWKTRDYGQFFISRTKPGMGRGNHYHDTKVEKFLVVEGHGLIRFRNVTTGETVEYRLTGRDFQVVDIPPGWTHSIQNVGEGEMVVLFWASEVFDAERPDTYPAEV